MRKAMNSIWLNKAVLCAGLLLCGPATAAPVEVDRIVAVVNSGVITEIELNRRVDQVLRQMATQKTQAPPRRQLTRQVLERMITERAVMQIAEDSNIRFDGPVLDRAIARIAQNNNLSPEAFRKALEADGVDFRAFREQIRTEMTISRLREREAENKVVVTDAEIDNFLAGQAQSDQRNEYRLAHILILTPEGASPEKLAQLRAKAAAALAELRAGADFAQVSAAYSDAQNALQGGVLGWRNEGQLPELFLRALANQKVGDVSDILRSGNGFHLFKLLDKRGRDAQTVVRQTRARHILVKTNEIVGDADARNRLLQLKERIEHGGDFAALAKQHSDDLSASRGGDLNWLNPGDTVPQFERAMDALSPGEVSEPVQSPFGWHLIQVQERRDQDVTEERKRLEARRVIRERKTEEAFEDWVRQARDRAYVESRMEE
ncbi:MAG: peptidyl-prolyl cis-trans isomerase SurA [bacterium]|nr:MAG: peptidyl-prolyl cis-trans isomerase SurA [bacterium]KAF0149545.1 MAG: peptidyl-prolyl cis-trans isomerase SurA [bacterium]KAF0168771.1 MAG: peptidyl-prolyl cis-trans isomerase SurA [bacterium]TXT16851.1 MAG: peptidyl-prolyl cis-trans isomerase SurA [bacterium]